MLITIIVSYCFIGGKILSGFSNGVVWVIASQPKIFNPHIEEAFSCIESIKTNHIHSDVERSIIKYQSLYDDTLPVLLILSNTLTTLLKKFHPNPEITLAYVDCSDGHKSDFTNFFESDFMRGPNKPPKKCTIQYQPSLNQDTKHFDETHMKSSKKCGVDDTCNHTSYYATTVVPQIALPTARPIGLLLNSNNFAADDCEGDHPHAAGTIQCTHKADPCIANLQNESVGFSSNLNQEHPIPGCGTVNHKTASMYPDSMPQALKTISPSLNTEDGIMEMPKPQKAAKTSYVVTSCSDGYKKPSYVVLVGDRVRTCNTKLYASLPLQNKYMVKQRVQDSTGATRIKLVLKSSHER